MSNNTIDNHTGYFSWESSALTNQGKVRKINQDAFLSRPEIGMWLVADGMGGHTAGELASQTIVKTFEHATLPDSLSQKVDFLEDNLKAINRHLLLEARRRGDDTVIGSTVVIQLIDHASCILLWAGDSRAYRFRNGELLQLTQDHSQVEEMVQRGLLLREEADSHPLSNIITRAVGAYETLYVDIIDYDIQDGDIFLLCSDGLNKELSAVEIAEILATNTSIQKMNQTLINRSLAKGGRDNVTTVLTKANRNSRT